MAAKRYFAAANTANGFINYFGHINPGDDSFNYILKGGPGTGKSTLMKKIGSHFEGQGLDVEYFHCASDPESLDGVRIPAASSAVIDGTAPHITEARVPGVCDAIVNLGEFIDPVVRDSKKLILPLLQEKKHHFELVDCYLRAAGSLYRAEIKALETRPNKKASLNASGFLDAVDLSCAGKGRERNLFLSSLDCESLPDSNNYKKVITVDSAPDGYLILSEAARMLSAQGLEYTFFSSLLCPEYPQALDIAGVLLRVAESLSDMVQKILDEARKALLAARLAHKQIETFYRPALDLNGLDTATQKLIETIESCTTRIRHVDFLPR